MGSSGIDHFLQVVACAQDRHQPGMVLLAAVVCVMTTSMALTQVRHALGMPRAQRWRWGLLAGSMLGFGGWAAHFLILLGYDSGYVAGFSTPKTIASLLIGVFGSQAALWFSLQTSGRVGNLLAGALLSARLAAMHYVGMAAMDVPALLHGDWHLIVASVLFPAPLFHAAFMLTKCKRASVSVAAGAALICTAILVLHFTGTAALSLTPSRINEPGIPMSQSTLALWICIGCGSVIIAGATAHYLRRRAHRAQQLNSRQFAQLLRGTSDSAICMLDNHGRVAQWNAGGLTLTGYDADEAARLPFAHFFTPQDRADGRPARALQEADEHGIGKGEWLCQRRDGSTFWAQGTVEKLYDENETPIGYSLITRDITRIKTAQDALAEKTQQFDTAIEHMHQGLCMFDADERLVLANRAFFRIWSVAPETCPLGLTLEEMVWKGIFPSEAPMAETLGFIRDTVRHAMQTDDSPSYTVEARENLIVSVTNRAVPGGGWITVFDDITLQRRSEARIAHMAMHDALTGLPNRNHFYQSLDTMMELAAQEETQGGNNVAVIAIDLNRFKEINDTFGHASGDYLLQTLASRFMTGMKPGEAIARLGGDEFAAAVRFCTFSQLDDLLTRIEACITTPVADARQPLVVGASLGVAIYPQDGLEREALLNNADLAMYRAKATLGKTVCFFEPGMDENARERRLLASDLHDAAQRGELSVLYQPQRSLHSDELSGYEALVRWQHPQRGMVSPAEFIPIAEETGEIIVLGEWVLRQACLEARSWTGEEKVAVNLSPVQFMQPDLIDRVRTILLETGLPPRRLELEITETAIIADKLRALHCLRQIKAMGVSVALDDFGTGYSSLDTLQSFPFDKIKIDRSFLLRSETSAQAVAIIREVLALGRSLDIPVLAEGVETEAQRDLLVAEGCDEAQGYYFGRPAAPHSTHPTPGFAVLPASMEN
ncbi:bifunctional diguanylate cyclase/phosphodiesterase [Novosphingobium sp. Leaf2]|uniref:bifunctional diguanylate cyclase/phosphodiesterase n=1 Tax=Novosphingobium sp. Leaf2 TaxID=1735670 RepID=UPI0009ECAEDE|nr:EAL domain-containing protein [Novosphingobium sp. Leaf2]